MWLCCRRVSFDCPRAAVCLLAVRRLLPAATVVLICSFRCFVTVSVLFLPTSTSPTHAHPYMYLIGSPARVCLGSDVGLTCLVFMSRRCRNVFRRVLGGLRSESEFRLISDGVVRLLQTCIDERRSRLPKSRKAVSSSGPPLQCYRPQRRYRYYYYYYYRRYCYEL